MGDRFRKPPWIPKSTLLHKIEYYNKYSQPSISMVSTNHGVKFQVESIDVGPWLVESLDIKPIDTKPADMEG